MHQGAALLQAIRDKRDDILSRLAYADWLDEDGQLHRAAAIRTEVEAARILGWQNVHGILDVEEHFGVTYTEEMLATLQRKTFTPETLQECRNTHLLVAGYPITILTLFDRNPKWFYWQSTMRQERRGLSKQSYTAKTRVALRWYLLRKEPVPGSLGEPYREQLRLLRREMVPLACVVAYTILLHCQVTGEWLLKQVNCQEQSFPSGHSAEHSVVTVGGDNGYIFVCEMDANCLRYGMAAARQF